MSWFPGLGRTRSTQLGFIVLLLVCAAQLAYWLIDETRYTAEVAQRLESGYAREAEAARAMLSAGMPVKEVARMHPEIVILPDSTVIVAPEALQRIRDQRFHRLNRYAWEGAFFLVVLLGAIAVVYRALREDRELRRRQDNFIAAVSHELKTPLASLRLSADTLALRDLGRERHAALVQRMREDLDRLQRMIANILDASRLSTQARASERVRLSLAAEVHAVVDELRDHAAHTGARIIVDVPEDLAITANPDRARTVLRNVVDNAIKATSGGGEVAIRAARHDGRVHCEVHDTGTGFPPREADRLFEKFYRVEREGEARTGGTGLGLYLAWRAARLDDGSITASSGGAGTGATFTITWPAEDHRSERTERAS